MEDEPAFAALGPAGEDGAAFGDEADALIFLDGRGPKLRTAIGLRLVE